MNVLGINPGHDATACLINGEGNILAAVAEERISRVKFDFGIPYLAIEECLRIANISQEDIDLIGIGFEQFLYPDTPYYNELMLEKKPASFDYDDLRLGYRSRLHAVTQLIWTNIRALAVPHTRNEDYLAAVMKFTHETMKKTFRDMGFENAEVLTVDHHLTHAASAYYTSGFEDPLIVTIDGSGDGLCGSINLCENGEIERLKGATNRYSPGLFYSEVTHHLGFRRNRHEGKITGLAAYGSPENTIGYMTKCLDVSADMDSFVCTLEPDSSVARKFKTFTSLLKGEKQINPHISMVADGLSKNLRGVSREDVAAGAQQCLENVSVEYVENAVRRHGRTRVALAGGVFANVKLNQRIFEIPGVEEVYVHPNMGDGGVSYGAAVLALKKKHPDANLESKQINDVYFGAEFTDDEIKRVIDEHGLEADYVKNFEAEVARNIAEKKIVGRFGGRMEYGPRALGNRSILADPTDQSINDWLNKRLNRTEFMPFAPSVLDRAAPSMYKDFLKGAYTSSFMTVTFDVTKEWIKRAPAVVHVDGTARPQVVREEHNPVYYRILEEYEKRTGLPLFVNTSFNMHEEPIVCTPEDAIRSFLAGSADVLSIGSFILKSDSK